MMTRRKFLSFLGETLAVGAGGTALYACGIEPHRLEIVRREMSMEGLPKSLDNATLLQLSDLHIGNRVDDDYLADCFEKAKTLHPDFVAFTGDAVDRRGTPDGFHGLSPHVEKLFPLFPRGRLGTFAILGNHDYGLNWRDADFANQVAARIGAEGIRVLRNETLVCAGLRFTGLDDLWARRFDIRALHEALAAHPPAAIVLTHNPDTVDLPGWEGFRGWILAGHTHGGQVKPPFLAPPILPIRNPLYAAGEINLKDSRRLYVNRGLGHTLQIRFNCRPELTLFTLRAE